MIYVVMKEETIKGTSIGRPVTASSDEKKATDQVELLNTKARSRGDFTFYYMEAVFEI